MISYKNKKFNPKNEITIINGNCNDVLKQIEDESLQLIITSPPYNIGKEYEKIKPFDEYIESQKEVINLCTKKLNRHGSICWQIGNNIQGKGKNSEVFPLDIIFYDLFKNNGLTLRNRIIWHFGHGLHTKYRLSGRHETILWFTKTNDYTFNLDAVRIGQKYPGKKHYKGENRGRPSGNKSGKNPSDVWNFPNVKANHIEKTDHPAQFPLALAKRLIEALSDPGDFVFDPFLGSGTTVAAAIQLGRRVIGTELDKSYFKIAYKRAKQAIDGTLPERGNHPPYEPSKNTKLTTKPWK
jgi:DNA modification methylase|tara:strand:+ start:370 stop:1257 length:888 start_codon:yes stop_codon:yes gene_type:complete